MDKKVSGPPREAMIACRMIACSLSDFSLNTSLNILMSCVMHNFVNGRIDKKDAVKFIGDCLNAIPADAWQDAIDEINLENEGEDEE